MFNENELHPMIKLTIVAALLMGGIKVWNELQMTAQYARWADETHRSAVALERISDALEGKKPKAPEKVMRCGIGYVPNSKHDGPEYFPVCDGSSLFVDTVPPAGVR